MKKHFLLLFAACIITTVSGAFTIDFTAGGSYLCQLNKSKHYNPSTPGWLSATVSFAKRFEAGILVTTRTNTQVDKGYMDKYIWGYAIENAPFKAADVRYNQNLYAKYPAHLQSTQLFTGFKFLKSSRLECSIGLNAGIIQHTMPGYKFQCYGMASSGGIPPTPVIDLNASGISTFSLQYGTSINIHLKLVKNTFLQAGAMVSRYKDRSSYYETGVNNNPYYIPPHYNSISNNFSAYLGIGYRLDTKP